MPYMWHERFRFRFHFLFFPLERCSKGYIWRFVDVESFPKGRGGIAWQRDWLCVVVYGFGRDVEEKKPRLSGGKLIYESCYDE